MDESRELKELQIAANSWKDKKTTANTNHLHDLGSCKTHEISLIWKKSYTNESNGNANELALLNGKQLPFDERVRSFIDIEHSWQCKSKHVPVHDKML